MSGGTPHCDFTCPAHGIAWRRCPCGAELFEQRWQEYVAVSGQRASKCPGGHETSVRKAGDAYFCGLCGRRWS